MVKHLASVATAALVVVAGSSADVLLNDTFGPGEPPFGNLSRYTVTGGLSPFISNGELVATLFEDGSLFIDLSDLEDQLPGETIHCISFHYRHGSEYDIGTAMEISIHATVTESGNEIEPIVLSMARPFWNRCKYTLTQNGKDAGEVGFWASFDKNKKCPGAMCPDGTTPPWKITFDWLEGDKYWIEIDGQPLDIRMIREPEQEGLAGAPVFTHADGKITGIEVKVKELGEPEEKLGPATVMVQIDSITIDTEHQGSGTQALTMKPNEIERGAFLDVALTTDQPFMIPGVSKLEMGPEVFIHNFQVLGPNEAIATIQVDPRASNAGHAVTINNGENLLISDFLILPPGPVEPLPNLPPAIQVLGPLTIPANTPFTIDSLWQDPDDLFILGVLVVMEVVTTNELYDGGYFFVDSSSGQPVLRSFEVPGLPPGDYKIAAVVNDGLSAGAMAAAFFTVLGCAPCDADLTGDGAVDGADLGLVLGNWGGSGVGDLNVDGIVNGADLGLLLGSWGPCPPMPPPIACGDPCAGGCLSAHGTPFCIDVACCDAVCESDAFCCQASWDAICANQAVVLCAASVCGMANTQDCCAAGALPGCNDGRCCEQVCGFDPFCCDVAWDGICAGAAQKTCDALCPPPPVACPPAVNDCFTPVDTPGCSDVPCCEEVCAVDPFCCDFAWDAICANEAFTFCVKCDFTCVGTPEGEPCGADANGGCNSVPPIFGSIACGETVCGTAWADGGTRDTDWFLMPAGLGNTFVTITSFAEFPAVIGIVDTGGISDCSLATALNPFATAATCVEATIASFCLPPGTWWLFIAPNQFDGFPCDSTTNHYSLTLECGGQDCVALACGDAGHDCFTTGGPYCDDAACCEIVCGIDPFCCDVAWDGICVQEAVDNCGMAPIVNDECVDAVPLGLGSTDFTTVGATTSAPPLPDQCERGFGLGFVNDIWFTFIAPATGTLIAGTCNTATYDTRLAAYAGDCDVLAIEACNDDFPGCGLTSQMTFPVTAGGLYVIRVGGFGGSGTGTLTLTLVSE